jgi:hypothetical protein
MRVAVALSRRSAIVVMSGLPSLSRPGARLGTDQVHERGLQVGVDDAQFAHEPAREEERSQQGLRLGGVHHQFRQDRVGCRARRDLDVPHPRKAGQVVDRRVGDEGDRSSGHGGLDLLGGAVGDDPKSRSGSPAIASA